MGSGATRKERTNVGRLILTLTFGFALLLGLSGSGWAEACRKRMACCPEDGSMAASSCCADAASPCRIDEKPSMPTVWATPKTVSLDLDAPAILVANRFETSEPAPPSTPILPRESRGPPPDPRRIGPPLRAPPGR